MFPRYSDLTQVLKFKSKYPCTELFCSINYNKNEQLGRTKEFINFWFQSWLTILKIQKMTWITLSVFVILLNEPILFVLYSFHTWDIGGHIDGCGWPKGWQCWLLWKTGRWFQDGDAWRHGVYCSINWIQSGRSSHRNCRIKWSYAAVTDLC